MRSYPEFHSVEPNGTRAGQDPLGTPLMAGKGIRWARVGRCFECQTGTEGTGMAGWRPNRADAVEQG